MSTRRPPRKPRTSGIPASEAIVPSQASAPEPGPDAERLAYSVDEAAQLTGLSRDLLYDEMRRGHLPYIKVGRRRLITRPGLEQFLGITPKSGPSPASATAGEVKAAKGVP